jgi:phage shock protein B
MEETIIPVLIVGMLFIALPWLIFHYVTKWKTASSLTKEDENLLDDLHDLARRLDDRMCTIERIMSAENPNWRAMSCDPAKMGIEDQRMQSFEPGRTNQPARRI